MIDEREQGRLFAVAPVADSVATGESVALSATRRLTLRNKALLDAGVHPATRKPLRDGATCGSCTHHVVNGHTGRYFHKCGLVLITGGPASDIRTSWPACTSWEPEARP